uniref:ATP synthetase subunit 8 n=1 Tax=Thysanoteuthis rhombus TaxID=61751 RepID=D2K8A2_THYRH|nr:ATP synthase F0 subunit 8 [Thysanoteuthis rhombus]YP_010184524.1 ATP synthase F0 subunit 8 [Thysanoteuthis rhombus]ACZ72742.1 ATP synthetase subunit 8 [Thysanoteuthis rhombus]QVH33944.1 ATPase subunit 8 [Thysanoteuthis rhombus]QVH33956.1 ATPase subunit 8 [Thysanoteuthis rhombus]
MPQLSPINWLLLFIMFWSIMLINTSIMWWNTNNMYTISKTFSTNTNITYKW